MACLWHANSSPGRVVLDMHSWAVLFAVCDDGFSRILSAGWISAHSKKKDSQKDMADSPKRDRQPFMDSGPNHQYYNSALKWAAACDPATAASLAVPLLLTDAMGQITSVGWFNFFVSQIQYVGCRLPISAFISQPQLSSNCRLPTSTFIHLLVELSFGQENISGFWALLLDLDW